ncbi:protein kinase [Nonomuraea phyllanthi]|uniref:serine/threonine-protein kinase n=1 Tax=Nonomuraea phyllanthi TaxID=2219224 RepID=UPI001293C8AF|nr:serine/threonine-protein kinase [Nonomuraea phyllanthi]QFY13164.1 protein kinase [Nonomuraea phyllanthi]
MATGGSEASLGSRYVLLDEIGAGGMGTVWRARHRDTQEIVAVKLLRDGLAGDQDLVLRFVQERNVMRTLRHPNIVTVRDFVIEGERLALVMDLVEGGDLRTLLRQRDTLPPAEAAQLMAQVADALATAHAAGIVHRDIKPGNVLIDGATGQVRLTDFGVARIVHGPGLTRTTSIIGTPVYLSPEVADGNAPTPAVDVYALGLILYELLAGRPPFVGEHPMALLRQHAAATPRRLPGMPDPLWSVIASCAAKDPAVRPSARAVAMTLGEATASLAQWPVLPPVPREAPPSATSEALPATGPVTSETLPPASPVTSEALPPAGPLPSPTMGPPAHPTPAVPAPRTPVPAGTYGPSLTDTAPSATSGALPSTRHERRGQRLIIISTASLALLLSGTAVAVMAPWRAGNADPAPRAAAAPPRSADGPAGNAGPTPSTPAADTESIPVSSPKARTERKQPPETAVSEPPTTQPRSTEPKTPRAKTRKTQETAPEVADPSDNDREEQNATPNWRCRSWVSGGPGSGTEMSPCMAMVGDVFYLKGQIRGSSSVRSDIHVQLFNTDADTNISQPFICTGVSPSSAGEVVTCGPFKVSAPRSGAKIDVRQRWRKTGTASFGGGAESPWTLW